MDARLRAMGRALARSHDAEPTLDLLTQRARFLDHAARTRSRATRVGLGALAAALAALCILALVHHERAPAAVPLAFQVAGVPGQLGAWLAAPADQALPLRFTDGSTLSLSAGARARVTATSRDGARILLERGRVAVHVVHRQGTDFRFRAGPFELRVVGTRFTLGWDPARERFAVELLEGAVQVTGPGLRAPRLIRPGEQVELSATPASAAQATPAANAAAGPASAASGEPPAARTPPASAPAAVAPARVAIASRPARHTAGPRQLLRRAEIARRTRRPEDALNAMLALRERFADAPAARDSAFWLGRLYFDQLAAPVEAARWFDQSLRERPRGPYAREATGRLIECAMYSGDSARARRVAEAYLAQYPQGPHAALAQRLVDARAVAP